MAESFPAVPPESPRRPGFWRRWGIFLVPLLYLAVVFALQPAGRLGNSDVAPWLFRLVYDDYDGACMALRGLNAAAGRTASQFEHPPRPEDDEAFCAVLDSRPALKPGYYLEYPQITLLLFRLGHVGGPDVPVPAAVLDGWHNNLVEHAPRNEQEQILWRHLRRAVRIYEGVMACCLIALMLVLRAGYEPGGGLSGPVFLLVLPAALYFALFRFDVVPALFLALGLACLGRRCLIASAMFLGLATMVKVFPLFVAPIILRYLWPDRRAALTWAVAYGLTIAACLAPTLLSEGWDVTWMPYRIQLARVHEPGWTLYGYVLPQFLAEQTLVGKAFRLGGVLLVVLALVWRRPVDLVDVLRRGMVAVLAFVAVQLFYSEQWLLWFAPFLVPLARLDRRVLWLAVALDVVTFLSFPVAFDCGASPAEAFLRLPLVYARAAVWAGLAWTMLRPLEVPAAAKACPVGYNSGV